MDLGATLCRRTRPDCERCPFGDDCVANREGRQAELPSPRPRRHLPERRTAMLVLMHGGEIMLEKRPPTGIWGGLWSLPECAPEEAPAGAARRLGLDCDKISTLPGLSHTFSHYRLHIQPHRLDVGRASRLHEPGRLWLQVEDALQAALPTPVRKIIAGLT
jgi:A/G-specific adenine glycosylase